MHSMEKRHGYRCCILSHLSLIISHCKTFVHSQLFSTILDYAEAGEYDRSDGRSLRPFIERRETNVDFDEDVVFAEWCV